MTPRTDKEQQDLNAALLHAAQNGTPEVLREWIRKGADIEARYETNWPTKGFTPLLVAVNLSNWKAVAFLLENGADIVTAHLESHTAFRNAVRSLQTSGTTAEARADLDHVIELFIARGADPNMFPVMTPIRPLHLAIAMGRYELAERMMAAGADINLLSGKNDMTALMCAAWLGDDKEKSIAWLIDHGANVLEAGDIGLKAVAEGEEQHYLQEAKRQSLWKLVHDVSASMVNAKSGKGLPQPLKPPATRLKKMRGAGR